MSAPVDWAFDAIAGSDLTPIERLVLLVLADHADFHTGRNSWPSVGRVAAVAGVHRTSVQRALVSLEEKGLIVREGKRLRGVTAWRLPIDASLCRTPLHEEEGP